ncbi:diguanylate cyclase domain-containing protein [Ramlibacter sp.]|uniref:diguanylate cyclase domain-containing protein n=1 Tax=Ramlibacter sp. TaxID=1917967 RepID=UPI003D0F6CFC
MDALAVGFWGAYFGVAAVAFLAAAIPLAQGLPRVALLMAAAPFLNSPYVLAALGGFPGGPDLNLRIQSVTALFNSLALSGLMLLMLRTRGWVWRLWGASVLVVLAVAALSWSLPPRSGMLLATGYATFCTLVALALLFSRRALRHHRLAWLAVASVGSVSLGLVLTAWIAANSPGVPWPAHAVTALVVSAHELCMAFAVWSQFSHLAELRLVRAYGSGYDPVTRMRSLETAGNLINSVFATRGSETVGTIVVTVANLYAFENLHGRAEHNQALFVLATRLRNAVPRGVQMCRLGNDVFLLLLRGETSDRHLLDVALRVHERLSQPLTLGVGERPSEVRVGAHQWVPDFGIGVLAVPPDLNRAAAVNTARGMSRTALAYRSRIARYSAQQGDVLEVALPAAATR